MDDRSEIPTFVNGIWNKNFNIYFQKLFPASNMIRIQLSTIETVKNHPEEN